MRIFLPTAVAVMLAFQLQADEYTFKSPKAKAALRKYDDNIKDLESKYESASNELKQKLKKLKNGTRDELTKVLNDALKEAAQKVDLEEANAIKSAIEKIDGQGVRQLRKQRDVATVKNRLAEGLPGTRWRWRRSDEDKGNIVVSFGNGVWEFSDYFGKNGSWKAVSDYTVLAISPSGTRMEITFDRSLRYFLVISDKGNTRFGQQVK